MVINSSSGRRQNELSAGLDCCSSSVGSTQTGLRQSSGGEGFQKTLTPDFSVICAPMLRTGCLQLRNADA